MILKTRNNNVIRSCRELGTMHRASRIPITVLNEHLTCKLCKGYFIDATTIIECLHTFCKSCIVKYLEKNKYCPECDVQVHKTKPLLNIRSDKTLQDIVYKLVPRLFQNEMQRRQDYYVSHPEARPSLAEQKKETSYQHIFSPDETICITLNYHGSNRLIRYLSCPVAVSIAHIQKLIRAKYDLNEHHHKVAVLYNQDCLNSSLTLMDIAYIYSWKRKEPLELTYQIYEKTVKRIKLDDDNSVDNRDSQCDWKEVQLQISENGEMSVTGIQDSVQILNEHKILEKDEMKVDVFPLINSLEHESKEKENATETKVDESCKGSNSDVNNVSDKTETVALPKTTFCTTTSNTTTTVVNNLTSATIATSTNSQSKSSVSVTCASMPNATATTTSTDSRKNSSHPIITSTSSCGTKLTLKYKNLNSEKKHKLDTSKHEDEPSEKRRKSTILSNHTLGVEKLSNNHPLKKHSQMNRSSSDNGERTTVTTASTAASIISTTSTTTTEINSTTISTSVPAVAVTSQNVVINKVTTTPIRPGTPITTPMGPKWTSRSSTPPCYVPKTTYSPIINIPNVQPSTSTSKTTESNKSAIKSKPSTPIGYKTLRDPPKAWNPQLPRPNLSKPSPDSKYPDKNARPAKFFKMRNNMPRYLGNPASGVKPLYQVHMSPEKEKSFDGSKPEKSEIKKHSIVKIDPKTLKPISERAPETSNLSNQSDLKINTSSVSIFNPLKLQSSPKGDRKSPKSPHSPKKSTSPTYKRDKITLGFTPPNPFVPNLTSPTLNPQHHFLFPSGPGFPPYDPRFMAAYNYLYTQRIPFSPTPPITTLSLDLNQRKNFDLHTPTSPQLANLPQQQQSPKSSSNSSTKSNNQQSHKIVTTTGCNTNSGSSSCSSSSSSSNSNNTGSCSNNNNHNTTGTNQKGGKKVKDGSKNEKSLENAVEKLTQNRLKNDLKQEKCGETIKEDQTQQQPQHQQHQQQQLQQEDKEQKVKDERVNKERDDVKIEKDEKKRKVGDNDDDKGKTDDDDVKNVSEETTLNANNNNNKHDNKDDGSNVNENDNKNDVKKEINDDNNKVCDKSNNNSKKTNNDGDDDDNNKLVAVDKN